MKLVFTARAFYLAIFILNFNIDFALADESKFKAKTDNITLTLAGKATQEAFFAAYMTLLNHCVGNDSVAYLRTTADYFLWILYGSEKAPKLSFYNTLRFRYRWGNLTDVRSGDSFVTISDVRLNLKGTGVNKHLVWMRESWIKIMLSGSDNEKSNFVEFGLIPFQVGRGISLGAAYEAVGFLGFTPGFSIDQYAPAVLLSFAPADKYTFDFYCAITENNQISLSDNIEVIRSSEINGCRSRGVGKQSYILALRNNITALDRDREKIFIEPYIVHQHAPDQDLEFKNDVDSFLTTAGCGIEAVQGRFNWGAEGALNFGELNIKPWDRNSIKVVKDSNAFVVEQYTKVYTSDPAQAGATLALASNANAAIVSSSIQNVNENGKEISTNPVLYNALDRFRPQQRRLLTGYFAVADATYDCIPKVLNCSIGVGYASGYIDQQRDANLLTPEQLMNEKFTAFIPLQSVYSGTRIKHLVMFNQGVPRFNVKNPNADLTNQNITPILQSETVNDMTNIAFIGVHANWTVQQLSKYVVNLSPNIVFYWAPETSHVVVSPAGVTPVLTQSSNNFIGTELLAEISAIFYERLKLYSYIGCLVPGKHFKDMRGTLIAKYNNLPTGSDLGYVCNIGASYTF